MKQELIDVKKLDYDLKHQATQEVLKQDLATLVDDIFGVGKYFIIKLEGEKE